MKEGNDGTLATIASHIDAVINDVAAVSRAVGPRIPTARGVDMERLLGGTGTAVTIRLGLAPEASGAEIREAITREHARWQRVAVSPVSSPTEAPGRSGPPTDLRGMFSQY